MNAERRQQLRQLAEKAQAHRDPPWPTFEYLCDPEEGFYTTQMRLIEAMSPDAVLALLDALDQAEEALRRIAAWNSGWHDTVAMLGKIAADALAPAGREQQEPAA